MSVKRKGVISLLLSNAHLRSLQQYFHRVLIDFHAVVINFCFSRSNPMVKLFKLNFFSSTFTWQTLFCVQFLFHETTHYDQSNQTSSATLLRLTLTLFSPQGGETILYEKLPKYIFFSNQIKTIPFLGWIGIVNTVLV